jgi:hypothetical protein
MVNRAIETLVPIIAKDQGEQLVHYRWLDHLWEANQNDRMPSIEYLGRIHLDKSQFDVLSLIKHKFLTKQGVNSYFEVKAGK